MTRYRATTLRAAGLVLGLFLAHGNTAHAAEPRQANTALLDAMSTELKRAMSSLGATGADADKQPKPYFLSYSVSDSDSFNMTAQYGALTLQGQSRRRTADVQMRIGTPEQDNTHGDHRASALTTIPLPLSDDREAIDRSLWFATNRGYAKALDSYLKVKTEQQVRAKEEDASADFSTEKPTTEILPASSPLSIDRTGWEKRLREISGLFRQYP
jgi:hypothetical protein